MPYGIALIRRHIVVLCLALPSLTGCAAFHPMNGVPVRYVPDELKVGDRNGKRTIDPSLLGQHWNGVHLVDTGDILGVYIGGVLGKIDENPQVQIPQNSELPPLAGTPVTVREDGTISLPMIGALPVRGKTISETEEAIRLAYTNHATGKEFLKPDRERILVSLQRARQTRVLVLRQDSRNEPLPNSALGLLNIGTAKRGTGRVISLPAYRNDVLNALVMTDGLPGLDAQNEVYVIRRKQSLTGTDSLFHEPFDPAELIRQSKKLEKPVIRSQNPGGWTMQTEGQDPIGSTSGSAGMPSSQSFGNKTPVQPGYSNPSFPSGNFRQSAVDADRDFGTSPFDPTRQRGFESQSVDRASYQTPQPWGPPSGMSAQWNTGTPPNPYSPTRLNDPIQQPYSQAPTPQLRPEPDYSNSRSPNWPPPQQPVVAPQQSVIPPQQTFGAPPPGFGMPPGLGTQAPAPGYSLPPAPPSGTPGTGMPVMNGYGPLNDPRGTDQSVNSGAQDIGLADGRRIIRIPMRLGPDERIDIRPEDVILHDGDIVFIEARDTEVFFTGGLLGGGQFTLPRDYDLDILQALSIASSRNVAGGAPRAIGGVSALNSDVTISPSNVVIIRKLPEGGEIPIKVDLYQARNDLSERIVVQPGDYIYLQYTPLEAVAAFVDRHLLEGAFFGLFAQQLTRPTN